MRNVECGMRNVECGMMRVEKFEMFEGFEKFEGLRSSDVLKLRGQKVKSSLLMAKS